MSKIIFLMPPAHGHINPALPVMGELVRRGEQVIGYCTDEFREKIESTGAAFRAYAPGGLTSATLAAVLQDGNLAKSTQLLLESSESLTPFVVDELAREMPDLVVFDSIALWGKIASAHLGLRRAASISHFVFDLSRAGMAWHETLALSIQYLSNLPKILPPRRRLIRQYGSAYPMAQPLFPMRDDLNIIYTARDLHPPTPLIDERFRFVGPSINLQPSSIPFPFDALDGAKPVVYISLGTVHQMHSAFYSECFTAFRDHPATFVLSVGKHTDIAALGEIPANFIVRPFVPQIDVLRQADVFITHGGINSVQEGLYLGVPLIVIPHQVEQLLNARVVEAHGAGLTLKHQLAGKTLMAADLRQALDQVLADPRFGDDAKKVQQMLQATGGFKQAADELQTYLAKKP